MKKLLLLLLCVPLLFSCGEEEGEFNKEKSHNTETKLFLKVFSNQKIKLTFKFVLVD